MDRFIFKIPQTRGKQAGYSFYILNAVDKAKESCKTNGEAVSDHFVDVNKTIRIG